MNIRKSIDYNDMYSKLDSIIAQNRSQMNMYCAIGAVVSGRIEKGAAVAASMYLTTTYPDMTGFSPRNLRRMRDFYRTYKNYPDVLAITMDVNWTQNVVIMESKLTMPERSWYLKRVAVLNWSKITLIEMIEHAVHLVEALDSLEHSCYTIEENVATEKIYEEPAVCTPAHFTSGLDGQNDRRPICPRICMYRKNYSAIGERRLRQVRPPDWNGTSRPPRYVPYLRRRLYRQNAPPDRVFRSPLNLHSFGRIAFIL